MIQFDEHILQMGLGWNHQLDEVDDLKGDNQQKIMEKELVPKWFAVFFKEFF